MGQDPAAVAEILNKHVRRRSKAKKRSEYLFSYGTAMIKVSHLSKRFPGVTAVDDVSFEVRQGEIVGFLGPNGAGKTTTMRILCGYLPASRGRVEVAGHDVFSESLEVRRRIGYMPENVPLYPEMRVDEYLMFRAQLRGLPLRDGRRRLEEVRALCGLENAGRRIIGQLSKGYRQRVGLADALIHDPELVILDEPTIGLDPNQIREVRDLIRSLAPRHTVLLSTHILSEAEVTCERVIIINRGRIVASDSPANLRRLVHIGAVVRVELKAEKPQVRGVLAGLPAVENLVVEGEDNGWLRVRVEGSADVDLRENIFDAVTQRGWKLRELHMEPSRLEEVFASLTQGETVSETSGAGQKEDSVE